MVAHAPISEEFVSVSVSPAIQSLLAAKALNFPKYPHFNVSDRNDIFRCRSLLLELASVENITSFYSINYIDYPSQPHTTRPSKPVRTVYLADGCLSSTRLPVVKIRYQSKRHCFRIIYPSAPAFRIRKPSPSTAHLYHEPAKWVPTPPFVSQTGTSKATEYVSDELIDSNVHKQNLAAKAFVKHHKAQLATIQEKQTKKKKDIERTILQSERRQLKSEFVSQVGINLNHKLDKKSVEMLSAEMRKVTQILDQSSGDIAKASTDIAKHVGEGVGVAENFKFFFWIALATTVSALIASGKVGNRTFLLLLLSTTLPPILWKVIKPHFEEKIVSQGPINLGFMTPMICTMMTFFCFGGGKLFQSNSNIFRNLGSFPRVCTGVSDIGSFLGELIEWCFNKIRGMFGKDPIRVFNTGKQDIDEYLKKVDILAEESRAGKETSDDFIQGLLDLRRCGGELLEKRRWAPLYERPIAKANATLDKIISFHAATIQGYSGLRQEPVVLALRGEPGAGKSLLMLALAEVFVPAILGPEAVEKEDYSANHYTFTKNSVTPYWTGHGPNCKITCYDDWGQVLATPGPENVFAELISIVTPWACQLNMAEVEAKGKSYFKDPLVMLTTNLKDLSEARKVLVSEEAVARRLHHSYEVKPNSAWALPDGKLDGSKVEKFRAEHGRFPFEAFDIREWDFRLGQAANMTDPQIISCRELISRVMRNVNNNKVRKTQQANNKKELQDLGLEFFSQGGHHSKPSDDDEDIQSVYDESEHSTKAAPPRTFAMKKKGIHLKSRYPSDDSTTDNAEPSIFDTAGMLRKVKRDLVSETTPIFKDVYKFLTSPIAIFFFSVVAWTIFFKLVIALLKNIVGFLVGAFIKPILNVFKKHPTPPPQDPKSMNYIRKHLPQVSIETQKAIAELISKDSLVTTKLNDPPEAQAADTEGENKTFTEAVQGLFGKMVNQSNEPPLTKGGTTLKIVDQGGFSTNEQLLEGLNRNQFLVIVTTTAEKAQDDGTICVTTNTCSTGILTVLENEFALFPNHITQGLARDITKGIHTNDSEVSLINLYTPTHKARLKLKLFLDSQVYKHENKDIAILKLATLQKRRSIVSKFITNADASSLIHPDVRVCTVTLDTKTPTNLVRYGKAKRITKVEVSDEHPRVVLDGWLYDIATTFGDCGGLVTLLDNSWTGSRKIIGFHTGGDTVRGLAVGVTQEFLRSILKDLGSIECEVDFPPPTSCFTDQSGAGEHLTELSKELSVSLCPKTSLFPTKLHNKWGTFDLVPALLHPKGDVNPMNNIRAKYLHYPTTMPQTLLRRATHVAYRPFFEVSVDEPRCILTFREAVEGKRDLEYCKGLPRSTSAGWPANTKPGAGKKVFFGSSEAYEFTSQACQELELEVDRLEALGHKRIRGNHVYTDFLKDELRSQDKHDKGQTRLISSAPLPYSILFRKYFMAFFAAQQKHRIETGFLVGINVYKEWTRLAKHLKSKGPHIVAGDYRGFDYTASPDVHNAILEKIQEWYNDDYRNIREVLWKELTNSIHLGTDTGGLSSTLYAWVGCTPSGYPGTGPVNTSDNKVTMIMVFDDISPYRAEEFDNHVAFAGYGDDNALGIHPDCIDEFNQNTIAAAMVAYGREYTNDRKDEAYTPNSRRLEEVTLLKRDFVPHGHIYKAPLNLTSILTIPYWCANKRDEATIVNQNIETTLMELSLHTPQVWDNYAPKIAAAALKHIGYQTAQPVDQDLYFGSALERTDFW